MVDMALPSAQSRFTAGAIPVYNDKGENKHSALYLRLEPAKKHSLKSVYMVLLIAGVLNGNGYLSSRCNDVMTVVVVVLHFVYYSSNSFIVYR